MTCFSRFYKKEKMISRTLDIDENLYLELERLSNDVYDASISKLVNAAIEELIKKEDINIYENKNKSYVSRSFLIRESLLDGIYELKSKYRISLCLIVNIAIRNAIIDDLFIEEVKGGKEDKKNCINSKYYIFITFDKKVEYNIAY